MSLPRYEHFKYGVGEFVRSSFCAIDPGASSRRESLRSTFQIVERMYQECPGGVQLHYLCRPHGMISTEQYVRLNEIELIPLAEDDESPQ